jgi:putative SOS response-associated peptidase YedK
VLTTAPRDEVAAIHHRQPAVLEEQGDIIDWLEPDTPQRRLRTLAAQSRTRPLHIQEVSAAVNNARNDSRGIACQTALPL